MLPVFELTNLGMSAILKDDPVFNKIIREAVWWVRGDINNNPPTSPEQSPAILATLKVDKIFSTVRAFGDALALFMQEKGMNKNESNVGFRVTLDADNCLRHLYLISVSPLEKADRVRLKQLFGFRAAELSEHVYRLVKEA